MKIKCDYCGNYIDESDEKCSYCGATNNGIKRVGNQVPKTIEELKQWYIDHNLPDENTTRFFIGKDYPGPKAFGIYKQADGDFVVYKNKSDGTRMTRYVGKDEAYAVQELYLRLKDEVKYQKSNNVVYNATSFYPPNTRSRNYMPDDRVRSNVPSVSLPVCIIIVIIVIIVMIAITSTNSRRHYSSYSNYNDYNDYSYDDSYSSSSSSSSSSSYSSWDNDDDWDSSSSWDSYDSWDSDWSDWDSDW